MILQEAGIARKMTEKVLVAGIRFRDDYERKKIPLMFDRLFQVCKDQICGDPITLYDYGVYSDGIQVEVCLPVTDPVEKGEVKSRTLESVDVLSLIHHGPTEKMKESYRKLYGYFREHGIVATNFGREITLKSDPENPEENVVEIQAVLHRWDDRLTKNLDRVLGSEARKKIMRGSDVSFTLESGIDERAEWIKDAIERLDELAGDEQKYDILSCCAHDFSKRRIAELQAIYSKSRDLDKVINAMHKDTTWYEKPRREGKTIHVKKIPFDAENYKTVTDPDEKRKCYCHCAMVRNHLNTGISPTFCYCGAGWYRQQWEGILGKPVKVEIRKSLLKGDTTCEFAVHLP